MSGVVRPRGPLPPRVYWRRRLFVLVVLAGAVVLAGRVLPIGGATPPTAPTANRAAPSAAPSVSNKPGADQSAGKSSSSATQPKSEKQRAASKAGTRAERASRVTSRLQAPAGACQPSDVQIVPDVQDTEARASVPLRLGLSTSGVEACTFEFGSETVAIEVTSGEDLIWDSTACARTLETQSVVVRPGWLSYVTVDWTGRRGTEGCPDGSAFAQPGFYWAEAAAVGGEPYRGQFELVTPPPEPSPSETPSEDPAEQPSETPSEEPSGEPSEEEPTGEPTQDETAADTRSSASQSGG
ncbi:MAG: hypothetical protein ACRDOY_05170 [Nocardioidaceae bacterium]